MKNYYQIRLFMLYQVCHNIEDRVMGVPKRRLLGRDAVVELFK